MTVQEILKKLVSFPVLGGQSNLSILNWIKEYVEDYGIKTYLVPNDKGDKASLHCRIGPPVDDGVILSGHMDVVPVEGQDWATDPFVLTDIGDGKLYGRGSCDMKGFLACCLAMLPEMVEVELKQPIYFAFSYDEEIGCLSAPELIDHIKQNYTERIKYAIIGEPSMMQPIVGQKGICVVQTTVNGSAGHSSRIRQEVSAIHESARLILWLEAKMNALVEEGKIDDRFSPPHTSLHSGQINAGIAPNVIADKSVFMWDVRVIPQDDTIDIIDEFEAYCREREAILRETFPGFKIENVQFHPPVPPLNTSESDSVVPFIKSLTQVQELGTVAYAAEAGQFSNGGFQSVICGPGSIAQAHRANEFIEKDQLDKGVLMLKELINSLS
jgi:acetylornithine deacetylase